MSPFFSASLLWQGVCGLSSKGSDLSQTQPGAHRWGAGSRIDPRLHTRPRAALSSLGWPPPGSPPATSCTEPPQVAPGGYAGLQAPGTRWKRGSPVLPWAGVSSYTLSSEPPSPWRRPSWSPSGSKPCTTAWPTTPTSWRSLRGMWSSWTARRTRSGGWVWAWRGLSPGEAALPWAASAVLSVSPYFQGVPPRVGRPRGLQFPECTWGSARRMWPWESRAAASSTVQRQISAFQPLDSDQQWMCT